MERGPDVAHIPAAQFGYSGGVACNHDERWCE